MREIGFFDDLIATNKEVGLFQYIDDKNTNKEKERKKKSV